MSKTVILLFIFFMSFVGCSDKNSRSSNDSETQIDYNRPPNPYNPESDSEVINNSTRDGGSNKDTSTINTETDTETDTETETEIDTEVPDYTEYMCLINTVDQVECELCCDCLKGECEISSECRDACANHNFLSNTNFINVIAPSRIGADGSYVNCWIMGGTSSCINCCDCSDFYLCGDKHHCRDKCANFNK